MFFMHCSAVAYVAYRGRVRVTHGVVVVNTPRAGKHTHPSVTVSCTFADFDWPTRVTRVTLTRYPGYAARAVPRE